MDNEKLLEQIKNKFFNEQKKYITSIVREAFSNRRVVLVNEIVHRIKNLDVGVKQNSQELDWMYIESLSALRAQVGGRFENLKERWVAAGLPLKSHRGEVVEGITIDPEGWSELSRWLLKQSYEVRVCSKFSDGILKIRKIV